MNPSEVNKVVNARVLHDHVIELEFGDGYIGQLDLARALWGPVFEPLKDHDYFRQFRLEDETIRWPNDADFCPDVLRYWGDMGGVRNQEETDSYFCSQLSGRAAKTC